MTLTTIWSVVTKIIDISLVWLMFYYILKNIKGNVKLVLLLKGIIIILIIKLISSILNLYTVGLLLEYVIEWGPLALIVIFQPEIRGVLDMVGMDTGKYLILKLENFMRFGPSYNKI